MLKNSTILLVIWLGLGANVSAQFDIQVRLDRDTFLLYESVPVTVAIRNYSASPLTVPAGDESWLQFLITDEAGGLVRQVKSLSIAEPLVIGPGQTVRRVFDLLPLYELRQRGNYRLQGRVSFSGVVRLSPPIKFTILQGREIWRQIAGQPARPDQSESYRLYTLQVRRGEKNDLLYAGVHDQEKQLVYGMVPLGPLLAFEAPQARTDKEGRLHVLYRTRPRTFAYVCVDGQAQILDQALYSDLLSPPQLMVGTNQIVEVIGGEQIYPRPPATPQAEEPPPAPPPKRKKWWWPFGGEKKSSQPAKR